MRYGFIGCGNMGGAVARAVCRGVGPENVVLANRTPAKAEALAEALGCRAATHDVVAQDCDVIFLGVKPQMMADMLAGIAPILTKRSGRFVLVTMAAGLSMARVREMAGGAYPIIRIMPHTPVSLGAGMIQYCCDDVEPTQLQEWLAAMQPAGRLDEVQATKHLTNGEFWAVLEAAGGGGNLPRGAVIGTVEIADCVPVEELVDSLDNRERLLGDYSPGRFAWVLQNPVMFNLQIPARGQQGWWNWEEPT